MSSFAAAFVFLLVLGAGTAFGQVYGKVEGVVADRETGQPLVGTQVVIVGTNLGNVTNEDGYYFINNVPVGLQHVTAQYLGYQTITQEERILAGQTADVEFALPSEVVQAEGIVAVIEREPLVVRDNTISKTRFAGEEARRLPADDISGVAVLGAGVYEATSPGASSSRPLAGFVTGLVVDAGRGFIVRGGRATESALYVDGVLVTDFMNQLNTTDVGIFAVEEVDVVTGGFGAEFGHAQSGIVNIVTRDGGTDFHGNLRFTTDGRFGTEDYDVRERDAFEREPCCGYNELQVSLGGPVVPGKLTFFGSLEATGAADIDPRVAGFNPAMGAFNTSGSTETILPGNRGDRTRLQAKLTSFLTEDSRLTGTYLFARDQLESYQHNRSVFQHLSTTATRLKTHDVILGYDQTIFQTAERNLTLQVRGNLHQALLHAGTPRNPLSAAAILESRARESCGVECQIDDHTFEAGFLNYRFGDIEFFFEDSMPNTVPSLPALSVDHPDPVLGVAQVWSDAGFNSRFNHRNERRYGLRLDVDSQVTRIHRAKAGFEWNWINLSTRSGFLDGNFVAQVYDVEPRMGAFYVQDRLDFGDLVIDLGLRWDHWNPNTRFPVLPGVVNCEITSFAPITGCREDDAPFQDARTHSTLSPRLGVAHPITDRTQVRLSYGKFHQLPELQHYFQSYLSDNKTTFNQSYGNPNLDYVETTAFEVGITHLLSTDLVLDVVGYNRDRRGAIRADLFPPQTLDVRVGEVAVFTNADNGNVKGIDITVTKRFANYWSTDLAWSLQWARGTTSSPSAFIESGFAVLFDPENPGQFLLPPTEMSAEDFDRLHTINWQFNFRLPEDFRPGSLAGPLFRDLSLYLVYSAHSGEPFTRVNPLSRGDLLEDFNASRLPWVHSGDLRVVRGFELASGLHLEVFAVVKNFLDTKNILAVHGGTGQPDRAGLEERNSRGPVISPQFFEEGALQSFPIGLEDIRPEFRERIARQDLDGDGTITLEEGQEALRRAFVALSNTPYNYGEPRQVRFGVELRF